MARNGDDKKDKTIIYRVNESAFNKIENGAALSGKTCNDWCRDELLARLGEGIPLTANEQLLHQEIIRFGRAMLTYFDLQANGILTPENSQKIKELINSDYQEMAKMYFASLNELGRATDK
jgi:hypothetical protein